MSIDGKSDYNLFFKFIDAYSPNAFIGIDSKSPLNQELELMMEKNKQFFVIMDTIQMKILYCSKLSILLMGVAPADITPYHYFEGTHPSDMQRHSLGRSTVFKLAQDIYIAQNGVYFVSTNLKIRNQEGEYAQMLIQSYLFYRKEPINTVYMLEVHTDIDWYRKIKNGYHYSMGNDVSNFRYPDEDLLTLGNIFSDREFEILKLLDKGLSSSMIAQKLFLSQLTINTHRRNILQKSGKSNIAELLYDLRLTGVL
jgi:hypothetical protein